MLTDKQIRSAQPKDQKYSLSDLPGLYIFIQPSGAKLWRFRYQFMGKRRELSLGKYPALTLAAAREKALEYRAKLDANIDPYPFHRGRGKVSGAYTVSDALSDLFEYKAQSVSADYLQDCKDRAKNHILPRFGSRPLDSVTSQEYLDLIVSIDFSGKNHMATRIKGILSQMYQHAILAGRADSNPVNDLTGLVKRKPAKHYARITDPRRFAQLLTAIDNYQGQWQVRLALRFIPLVFARQIEIRRMTWDEVDLDRALWAISPEKMKMKRRHLVPLSTQAIAVLEDAARMNHKGKSGLVFPGMRSGKPLSENTISAAVHNLGFGSEEMTGHGFRGTAATLLNELGYPEEQVDMQLAHWSSKGSKVYNHATWLPQRTDMAQAWADYLDEIKLFYG